MKQKFYAYRCRSFGSFTHPSNAFKETPLCRSNLQGIEMPNNRQGQVWFIDGEEQTQVNKPSKVPRLVLTKMGVVTSPLLPMTMSAVRLKKDHENHTQVQQINPSHNKLWHTASGREETLFDLRRVYP